MLLGVGRNGLDVPDVRDVLILESDVFPVELRVVAFPEAAE